jgi:hypothetical protein
MGTAHLSSSTGALVAAVLLLGGCEPTCAETCKAVLACDLGTDRVSRQECEVSCTRQEAQYESWEDDDKLDLLADHKRCVVDATCDELAGGACYDEVLFPF